MSHTNNSYLSSLRIAAQRDVTNLHYLLREFVSSGQFLTFLELHTANKSFLKAAATRSYTHYNGFDKIVIVPKNNKNLFELRLHVWWESRSTRYAENIHDHKWDFSSVILKGGYDYEIFELGKAGEKGEKMAEFLFTTREGKQEYSTPFQGQKLLVCTTRGSIQQGDSYFLRHDVLHRISSERSQTTMTLVVQGPEVKRSARIFADERILPRKIESLPFTTLELKDKLEQVIATSKTWL